MDKQQLEAAFLASNLIFKFLKGTITPEEQSALTAWLEKDAANKILFSTLKDTAKFNELLNSFYSTAANKKTVHKKLRRRLFSNKAKILELTARIWRYVA